MTKEEIFQLEEHDRIEHATFGSCIVNSVSSGLGISLRPLTNEGIIAMREHFNRRQMEIFFESNSAAVISKEGVGVQMELI